MADTDTLTAPDDTRLKGATTGVPRPSDMGGVRQTLGLGGMDDVLAADRAKVDALEPGPPKLTPPPIAPPPADPFQAFGQPAMWLAALGGLLTRHPLTSSIQSAGAVMDSIHKQDAAGAQRAYDEWKINSENAMKMVKYEQDAYKAALAKYGTDARAGEAEVRTLAAAFKNSALTQVLNTEGMDGVVRYLKKGSKSAGDLATTGAALGKDLDSRVQIANGFISDDPVELAKALRLQGASLARDATGKGTTSASRMQADAIQLQLDTIAARIEKSADGGDQAGVDAAVKEAREIAGAGTGSLKPPRVGQKEKWVEAIDPTDGKPYEYKIDAEGNKIAKRDGNPYTPGGVAHVGSETKPPVAGSVNDTILKNETQLKKDHPEWDDARVSRTANARVRLAASPFMQTLNQKEAQAAQNEIDKDPTILDDPNRMGRLINQVTGRAEQKDTLTGAQIAQIDDHALRVGHLMDDLQRMRELLDNPGIASKLGRPLRAGEAIGNIIGAMNDTDRAEYDNLLRRVREEGPKLMSTKILPSETRPSEEEAAALFPSQRWGDTKQAVDNIFEDWQKRFVSDLRVYNAQKLASTGQGLLILGTGGKPAAPNTGATIRYDAQGNRIQ